MRFAELKTKEIIRMSDGKKLGFADDIVINEKTRQVIALRVPKATKGFKKPEYMEVAFSAIAKIGENVILIDDNTLPACNCDESKTKNEFYYSPRIFHRVDNKK